MLSINELKAKYMMADKTSVTYAELIKDTTEIKMAILKSKMGLVNSVQNKYILGEISRESYEEQIKIINEEFDVILKELDEAKASIAALYFS
jgi:hypothetical protein